MNLILKDIYSHSNKNKAKILSGFFKTGKGQYGERDLFWGLTVPISRKIAEKYKDISIVEIKSLLQNKVHEVRLIAILILVYRYKKGGELEKNTIFQFYLKNTKYINNWDLVDLSAPQIVGDFLFNFSSKSSLNKVLLKLVESKNLWEQRIAVVATYTFIKKNNLDLTFTIAKIFLDHKHDLIHKATGWMLREAGKRNVNKLRKFLDQNISKMPRTMLRYAIEKFPENLRLKYLKK
jgi:3-methyladenine DNA glycosylase AlkD